MQYIISIVILFAVMLMPEDTNALVNKSHGYAVFSKLKYDRNFKSFDYVNPEAPKGGEMKYHHVGSFDSLNSFILKGNSAPGLLETFDTLMTPAGDEPNSSYGLIAESIEYPKDKKWVIFNLHPEAKWHDGKPITAEDVEFSYNILLEKGSPNYKIAYQDIGKVEVINKRRVKFYIKNPLNPLVVPLIGEGLSILPKHFFVDKDFETYDTKPILGSGPYKVKDYKFNKFIKYERINDYWAKDLPVNKGSHNFDNIIYEMYLDAAVAVEGFKAGDYDFRQENISRIWATSYDIGAVKDGRIKKVNASHSVPANLQNIFMNMRRPDFKDRNFRKALTLAFDFDWMNANLFYGIYKRTESYFENTRFQATGIPEGRELEILEKYKDDLPGEVFTQPFVMPSTGDDLLKNRENLREAKQLLLDAGYTIKNGKMVSPYTKKPVKIEVLYHMPAFERIFGAFKANLERIGITLELRLLDHAQFWKRSKEFNFDLMSFAFVPTYIPGHFERFKWHSDSNIEGGLNFSGVNNKAVDELIEALLKASDEKQLLHNARALDRVLLWNYYSVPQFYSSEYRYLYWNKFGIPEIKPEYSIGLKTWWAKSAE